MNLLDFGLEVVAVSASGVLAPGPLFLMNLLYGTRQGAKSGIKMALGHTVVELPLVILLAAGLFTLALINQYSGIIGLFGGISILGFASLQIIRVARKSILATPSLVENNKSSFMVGIVFSALNPFFLVWWLTVGLKLVADSATFGFATGIAILFALHIWMDYAWLYVTAYLASKGSPVIRSKYYPLLLLSLAVILAYYGISFVAKSLSAGS